MPGTSASVVLAEAEGAISAFCGCACGGLVAAGVCWGVDAVAVRIPVVAVLQQGVFVRLLDMRAGRGRLSSVSSKVFIWHSLY